MCICSNFTQDSNFIMEKCTIGEALGKDCNVISVASTEKHGSIILMNCHKNSRTVNSEK